MMWILFFMPLLSCVTATVDVYIKTAEMNRTLGVAARLAYLVDGKQNAYQAQFPMPYMLRTDIDTLNIWWRNKGEKDISYIMELVVDEKQAVLGSISVPVVGVIPRKESKFTLSLPCTGLKHGDFTSRLFINYTWPSSERPSFVVLKQRKICTKGMSSHGSFGPEQDSHDSGATPWTSTEMFYIAIGCVCALVITVASIIVVYFRRAAKKPHTPHYHTSVVTSPGSTAQRQPFLRPDTSSSGGSKYSAVTGDARAPSSSLRVPSAAQGSGSIRSSSVPSTNGCFTAEPRHIDVAAAVEQLKGDRSCLELAQTELEGAFGLIQWATWHAPGSSRNSTRVPMLVKALKPTASQEQHRLFLAEALSLYGLPDHVHVAQVAVAFMDDETVSDVELSIITNTPLFCYVHQGFGNLKKFLLRCRGIESGRSQPLRTQDLVSIGVQIVRGMLHLHRNKVLHRDLATRNCLITDQLAVQVCDTALSRDFFPQDYCCLADGENRPVKWMAAEALDGHLFTSASDVWSFGVTLWELVTMGQQPYQNVDAEDMSRSLRQGVRLHQPYNCPDELYGVMFCCWGMHQHSRPTFEQLLIALDDFYAQLTDYV